MATAICRRAFSRLSLLVALLSAPPVQAGAVLTLDSLRHPSFEADGLRVSLATGRRGEADIQVDRLMVAGIEYRQLNLHCTGFVLDLRRLDCPHGLIRREDDRGRDRPALPFSFTYRFADGATTLAIEGAELVALSPLIKRMRVWRPEGRLDLKLTADRAQARLDLTVRQARFGSAAGDIAGEGIDLELEATAHRVADGWRWRAHLDWPAGELYVAPWYRKAGVRVDAEGALTAKALDVALARVALAGIGTVDASWRWDRAAAGMESFGFVTEPLDLGTAFAEWVQPWLDQSAVPKVSASGKVRFSGAWSGGAWQSAYAGLEEARLVDGTDYLEFAGMNARIPWERGVVSEAEFSVTSARLGELPLGGFRIPVRLHDDEAHFERLSIPLLDGRLYVDELFAKRHPDGWQGSFAGGIESVSLPKLTSAVKLPPMAGSLTARIPRAAYAGNVVTLDGDLVIEVFDGRIVATGLTVIDPLKPTRRFMLDLTARELDIGLLTQTFSFGSIEGRLDADIGGLELIGWQPARFDARVHSSPGDYRRAISRGALRDISALGGAAGAAAISLSPARFFNTFDYRRIGFGCSLRGAVCHFEGLAPAGTGALIVEGSGLPRVQVIGYNRRIDWNLLVSRIRAVIAGKSKAVIE